MWLYGSSPITRNETNSRSCCRQHQMLDLRFGRPHLHLNVLAQPGETDHQLAPGQVAKVAAHNAGDFGLPDAHQLCSLLLCETPTGHTLSDLDDQSGFDLEPFGISQAEVGKHVAITAMHLNVIN